MSKYSKAIGATVGALVAWGVAAGIPAFATINVDQVTNLIIVIGGLVGTYVAPANKTA